MCKARIIFQLEALTKFLYPEEESRDGMIKKYYNVPIKLVLKAIQISTL